MSLLDKKSKLSSLREEKERFIILLHSLDRRVESEEITTHQKKFTINSITQGLSEQEYLRILKDKILAEEIRVKKLKNPEVKNILIISSIIVLIIFSIIAVLIVPEIYYNHNIQTKETIIQLNKTYYGVDSQQYLLNISEDTRITSLKINGTYTGDVKIYLVSNITRERYLVFDSKKYDTNIISIAGNVFIIKGDPEKTGTSIINLCDETCKINLDPKEVYLEIVVHNQGFIYIKEVIYDQMTINHIGTTNT